VAQQAGSWTMQRSARSSRYQIDKASFRRVISIGARRAQLRRRLVRSGRRSRSENSAHTAGGRDAAVVPHRRLVGRARSDLGIGSSGQLSSQRTYAAGDIELGLRSRRLPTIFSLAYEQTVATSTNNDGMDPPRVARSLPPRRGASMRR
jgi:hypothetical protein